MAQPFDVRTRSLTGSVFPVAEGIAVSPVGEADFSVSTNRTLVFTEQRALTPALTWVDRSGKKLRVEQTTGFFFKPSLSPDESHVALESRGRGGTDIWVMDLLRGTTSRFTDDPANDLYPVYSYDGKQIVFGSPRSGTSAIYIKPATGVANEELLLEQKGFGSALDWSSDGKLLYNVVATGDSSDIWAAVDR